MAARDNPYFIEPANAMQALMSGYQGYDRASAAAKQAELQAGRQDAAAALQSGGDLKGMYAKLLGIGDVESAKTVADFAHQTAQAQYQQQNLAETSRHNRRAEELQEKGRIPFGWTAPPGGGAAAFVPNGPADPAYIERTAGAKDKTDEQIAARQKAVAAQGMDLNDPHTRAFVLTGRFPKEDQQPLTATDKKAILEADQHVLAHDQTIGLLKEAKDLSKKALGFKGAGYVGAVGAPFNQAAADTAQLDTLVSTKAVGELKTIFGGNPTEGERKILIDIAGSSSLPDTERQKIYDRAMNLVKLRREFAQRQANELRGGTYFKTGGGTSQGLQAPPDVRIGAPVAPKDQGRAPSRPIPAADYFRENP